MNGIMEAARRQEDRDATVREIQEEKRKQKTQRKMNHMKSSLSPEWKLLPGNEFKCSQTKKLTANDIMDMIDNGELTDEQAEIEFEKLEERKNKDKKNMDTATVKKTKNVLNELIKCDAIEPIEDNAITLEHDAPKETKGHKHLPICQEETQNLEYLAYGEEEINSESKEECNYYLVTLFEK